jgi:UDPglucose 6-dehydrogenase
MNTAIIGYGIVGKATHLGVLDLDPEVYIIDVNNQSLLDSLESSLVFICLPSDNSKDLQVIERYCRWLVSQNPEIKICVRSSVPVGFCSERLLDISQNLLYFPEFLRERHWIKDAKRSPWIIGCNVQNHAVLPALCKNKAPIFVSFAEAEIIKMMANAHSAMQVVFANHMFDISEKTGARYDVVEQCHHLVRHRDQSYLEVSADLRAFGGKCLPKDLDH